MYLYYWKSNLRLNYLGFPLWNCKTDVVCSWPWLLWVDNINLIYNTKALAGMVHSTLYETEYSSGIIKD